MIITEEEAKTKWCPHTRVNHGTSVFNRASQWVKAQLSKYQSADDNKFFQEQEEACRCIGSGCMMWVWITPDSPGWSDEPRKGTCGLKMYMGES